MLIKDILSAKPVTFSCELFPPKVGTDLEKADLVVEKTAALIAQLTDMDILGTPGRSTANPRLTARAIVLSPAGRCAVMYAAKFNIHTLPGGGVEEDVLTPSEIFLYSASAAS